MIITNQV